MKMRNHHREGRFMPVEIYPLVNWLKKRCGQENQICSHIFKKADTNGFIRGEKMCRTMVLSLCVGGVATLQVEVI